MVQMCIGVGYLLVDDAGLGVAFFFRGIATTYRDHRRAEAIR